MSKMCTPSAKFRKLQISRTDEIPKRSEIRSYMGDNVSTIFFNDCHPYTKKLLGLEPALNGPPECLWISPRNLKIDNHVLTVPFNIRDVKACTHQGILALGQIALKKHELAMYEKAQDLTKAELKEARLLFDAEKRKTIETILHEESVRCNKMILELKNEFRRNLENEIKTILKNCEKNLRKATDKTRHEVARFMLKKIRCEIGYIITDLYDHFEKLRRCQRESMIAEFNIIMRNERFKALENVETIKMQHEEDLRSKCSECEEKALKKIIDIFRTERIRSFLETFRTQKILEKQRDSLEKLKSETKLSISVLVKDVESKTARKEKEKYREKLEHILKQFQKFIDFTFNSPPGQADFVLSLERFLISSEDEEEKK